MNTRTPLSSQPAGWCTRTFLAFLALFLWTGATHRAQAQLNSSVTNSSVVIDRGSGNETYGGKGGVPSPAFDGANLGSFDISDLGTVLLINGGTIGTTETSPDVINGATLSYQVTNTSTGTSGNVTPINLPLASSSNGNKSFANISANRNILSGLTAGSYTVDVFFTATGRNTARNRTFTLSDPPNTSYQASFTVVGVRPTEGPNSTTWTGGKNDNWFDPANWTQGVPTPTKDTTIPDFGAGSTVQYPNIYSNAAKPTTTTTTTVNNPNGTTTTVTSTQPGYDNAGSGPAQTRNLIMQGTDQLQRSIARLVVGRLEVYGNFENEQDSFIQRENTTISFTGTDQTISGSASGLGNVEINGGGIKTLTKNFTVLAGGRLQFINGILVTDVTNVNVSFVELAAATQIGTDITPAAQLVGETETSYLRGFIKTTQPAVPNVAQNFSNIGVTLTFTTNDPGNVTVTRNTGGNYPTISSINNTKPSIRRVFGVRPTNQQTNNGGLRANMIFHYLDNETVNLQPNNQSLDETKLALFVSTSSGDIFGQLGRDIPVDTNNNNLTKSNITTFATFTLSEATAPLPVTLTAFNAKRAGQDALITWETASELNSRGYEVQVSVDGRTFRTLGFVASQSANSNQLLSYRFEDKEAGKSGIRYYRLRQIDLDGADHYYGPRVVSFAGSAATAELKGFPNPFEEALFLTASTTAAGNAQLSISDMTGRVLRQQTVALSAGTNDVTVTDVATLGSGVYFVRLVLPTGETQTMRVSKR